MSQDNIINKATNQKFYDYIADAWQYLLGQNFHWGYFATPEEPLDSATDTLIDMLVERLALDESKSILDVGCGIGGPARYLTKKFGCAITGFSTSDEGIGRATKAAQEAGVAEKLTFEVRDALDNQFKAETFDSVMLLEMSHLIRNKLKLMIESIRPLKVGGIITLCDLTLQRRLSAKEIVAYHPELQILERCFGKARLEPLSYYEKAFAHCGLEEVEVTDVSLNVNPTIQHWRDNADSNRATLTQHVSDNDVDDFIRSCDILQKLYDEGAWGYGLISARKVNDQEIIFDDSFDTALF